MVLDFLCCCDIAENLYFLNHFQSENSLGYFKTEIHALVCVWCAKGCKKDDVMYFGAPMRILHFNQSLIQMVSGLFGQCHSKVLEFES